MYSETDFKEKKRMRPYRRQFNSQEVGSILIDQPEGHRELHASYKLHHLNCIHARDDDRFHS